MLELNTAKLSLINKIWQYLIHFQFMYESIKVAVYIDYIYMYFVKSSSYQGRHVTWVSDDLLKNFQIKFLTSPRFLKLTLWSFSNPSQLKGINSCTAIKRNMESSGWVLLFKIWSYIFMFYPGKTNKNYILSCLPKGAMTFCEESAITVGYVQRCPVDSKSWEKPARRMNCEYIKHNWPQAFSKG